MRVNEYLKTVNMKHFLTILLLLHLATCFGQNSTDLVIADFEFDNGNYHQAIGLYSIVIESKNRPDRFEAYYGRACCYNALEEDKKAIADVKKALKVNKGNIYYESIKGNSYWLYSNIVSREKSSKKSLKLLKKSARYIQTSLLYSTIGFDEIYLGKYDDAIKSLETAIQLDKNNAFAYSNRSLGYLKLEKFELAREDVTRAIELDNTNPFAYKHSAMIYLALGNSDSACKELEKASVLPTGGRMTDHYLEEIDELRKEHCNHN